MPPVHPLLAPIQALHRRIRADVVRACEEAAVRTLAGVAREEEGDTIYAIDRVAEHVLVEEIGRTMASAEAPVVLVAEGLPGGEVVVPEGADRRQARCAAGAALFGLVERAADGRLGLGELTSLFWHCVKERPEALTREGVGEAVVAQGLAAVTPALRVLLGQILQGR